jgi:hypothetical protein
VRFSCSSSSDLGGRGKLRRRRRLSLFFSRPSAASPRGGGDSCPCSLSSEEAGRLGREREKRVVFCWFVVVRRERERAGGASEVFWRRRRGVLGTARRRSATAQRPSRLALSPLRHRARLRPPRLPPSRSPGQGRARGGSDPQASRSVAGGPGGSKGAREHRRVREGERARREEWRARLHR